MNYRKRYIHRGLTIFIVLVCGWSAVQVRSASAPDGDLPAASGGKSIDAKPDRSERTRPEDKIIVVDPPEKKFFSKVLDYQGIPIKAHKDVADEALFAARDRLSAMLVNLPDVRLSLHKAGAELHIIGRNQVTSDLPEWRQMKDKPFDGDQTIDQRTRGMGGLLTSCGEENLLKLEKDRYKGRDICVHEFAHNIFDNGSEAETRDKFKQQYRRSLDKGLWKKSYAGSNIDEFFAELSMWYFGTHGDLRMTGPKPENGAEGLKKYDPEAFTLIDEFYSGRMTRRNDAGGGNSHSTN
ncbi:MAG: hypothetical protein ABSA26_07755 [Thermoguttaceae bacterium]|jgi:alpha-glucosidase